MEKYPAKGLSGNSWFRAPNSVLWSMSRFFFSHFFFLILVSMENNGLGCHVFTRVPFTLLLLFLTSPLGPCSAL